LKGRVKNAARGEMKKERTFVPEGSEEAGEITDGKNMKKKGGGTQEEKKPKRTSALPEQRKIGGGGVERGGACRKKGGANGQAKNGKSYRMKMERTLARRKQFGAEGENGDLGKPREALGSGGGSKKSLKRGKKLLNQVGGFRRKKPSTRERTK